MTGQRVLVVGYGSIGARHARLLCEMGCDVAVVSARAIDFPQRHGSLREGWQVHRPTLVVVANATSAHYVTLVELAQLGHAGDVLVEKPMFDYVLPLPANHFRQLRVAYNPSNPLVASAKTKIAMPPATKTAPTDRSVVPRKLPNAASGRYM